MITTNRTFASKEKAIENAKSYGKYLKQDIYVYESTYTESDKEYTLRTRSEIISPDSDFIIHFEKYIKEL